MISQFSALLCRSRSATPSRNTVASVARTSGVSSQGSSRRVTLMFTAVSMARADAISWSSDRSR